MTTTQRSALMLLVLAVFPAGRLLAQDDDCRCRHTSQDLRPVTDDAHRYPQGWASFAFGGGSESYRYNGSDQFYSTAVTAPVFSGSIGSRLSPLVDVGVEGYGWVNGEQNGTVTLGGFQAIARLHPLGRWMYVKGGAGLATTNYWDPYYCGCSGGPTYFGFAYSVGGGLELPMGRSVALVPQVDMFFQKYSGRTFPSYTERILHVGLGLSFSFRT